MTMENRAAVPRKAVLEIGHWRVMLRGPGIYRPGLERPRPGSVRFGVGIVCGSAVRRDRPHPFRIRVMRAR